MTTNIGNLSLGLAVLFAALGALLAMSSARFESHRLLTAARFVVVGFAGLMGLASVALVTAFLQDDFAIRYVASYSERAMPFGYKLAAFWAGQEGSLLLWSLLLAIMSAVFVIDRRRDTVGPEASATMFSLCVVLGFFAMLMLFAANPFVPSTEFVQEGRGLNPMLQDPGMIAHPPLLFLGYAGYTFPFVMLVGALVANRRDNGWLDGIRRWSLASWLFLSIGILLGAQWAYVELGWGGYWAWDPVENASLLPWLTGTALLHSVMAQRHRGIFKIWNAGLIALTFALCVFGSYLTRSGVIQSVHSFGESVIGTFFLSFLITTVLVSAALIAWRRQALRPEHELPGLLGREGMFLATNVLLVAMALVTTVGTIFPILSNIVSGQQVTVGPNFYNKVVAPMGLALAGLMAVGPLLVYGQDAARRLARGLVLPGVLAALAVGAFVARGVREPWALACVAITTVACANIVADFLRNLVTRVRAQGENPLSATLHLLGHNHRRYGAQLVHVGVILIVAGITASSLFNVKENLTLKPGESARFAGRTLTFEKLQEVRRENFTAVEAIVKLMDATGAVTEYRPDRRFYNHWEEQPNSEVAIASTWKEDIYLTLVGWEAGGAVTAIQAIVNPLVSWIWTGGFVLTLGAIVGLLPRFVVDPFGIPATTADNRGDGRLALGGPSQVRSTAPARTAGRRRTLKHDPARIAAQASR